MIGPQTSMSRSLSLPTQEALTRTQQVAVGTAVGRKSVGTMDSSVQLSDSPIGMSTSYSMDAFRAPSPPVASLMTNGVAEPARTAGFIGLDDPSLSNNTVENDEAEEHSADHEEVDELMDDEEDSSTPPALSLSVPHARTGSRSPAFGALKTVPIKVEDNNASFPEKGPSPLVIGPLQESGIMPFASVHDQAGSEMDISLASDLPGDLVENDEPTSAPQQQRTTLPPNHTEATGPVPTQQPQGSYKLVNNSSRSTDTGSPTTPKPTFQDVNSVRMALANESNEHNVAKGSLVPRIDVPTMKADASNPLTKPQSLVSYGADAIASEPEPDNTPHLNLCDQSDTTIGDQEVHSTGLVNSDTSKPCTLPDPRATSQEVIDISDDEVDMLLDDEIQASPELESLRRLPDTSNYLVRFEFPRVFFLAHN